MTLQMHGFNVIRGCFSDTLLGRQLAFFARVLDSQIEQKRIAAAISTCRFAEALTTDRQWKAIRVTLELFA